MLKMMQSLRRFIKNQTLFLPQRLSMRMLMCGFLMAASPLLFAQSNTEAGKVLLSLGDVKVVRNGQTTPLSKGAGVQAGDSITTGVASNAQLRMSDGAVIALKAQTDFKINEYKFNGKADGSEKANLSLLKGGVRAVTGTIGKGENKDNLQVNAVVATVGIRGTGFNISYCEANCFNADKSAVKDGLYAGVFEGQILVKNQVATDTLGVNEYLYVADKNSQPVRLAQAPVFLADPLAGQKSIRTRGSSKSTAIPSLATSVNAPSTPADAAVSTPSSPLFLEMGIVVNPSPYLVSGIYPHNIYNIFAGGNGLLMPTGSYNFYLQNAETNPNVINPLDNLPLHSVVTGANLANPPPGLAVSYANTGTTSQTATVNQIGLPYPAYSVTGTNVPLIFSLLPLSYPSASPPYSVPLPNPAQQMEGGNFNNIVSWGRWANGNMIIANYNNGQPINIPENSGYHFIIGDRTNTTTLQNYVATPGQTSLSFNLLAATTPTAIVPSSGTTWAITSGSMTANFATAQLTGNVGLYTNQSSGYGNFNMAISSNLLSAANANNSVSINTTKINGSSPLCTAGCAGAGNVSFYGGNNGATLPAQAAGLSYNFNTGNNVVQGVAVFKR